MTKRSDTQKPKPATEGHPVIPAIAAYPGALVFLFGFALFYLTGRANPGMFTWRTSVAIGIMVLGGLLWFTSGMDKPHLLEWLRSAFIALFLALTIRWAIAEPYRIPSGSMEPTLHGDPRFGRGDRVFVNKWIYGVRFPFLNKRIWYGRKPERWDIVVFKSVEKNALHKTLVKRIVGMPGEHIQIRGGKIYVDGQPLTLPPDMPQDIFYTSPLGAPYGIQEPDAFSRIPEGHYLVLGDNSAHSRDGRYFGWLPNEHIVGRVSCIWWPPQRWCDFTGFSKTWWWRTTLILVVVFVLLRVFAFRLCAAPATDSTPKVDHYVVSFLHYGLHLPFFPMVLLPWRNPERGHKVLFSAFDEEKKHRFLSVGQVVGLPDEQIHFSNGVLHINGEPVKLPGLDGNRYEIPSHSAPFGRSKAKEYSLIPPDCYFILSENKDHHSARFDSRSLGWIERERILGKVVFCWWPPAHWGKK